KYGTDAALTSPTDVAGSGTSSPFTASLTGLTASTQYWAVGYATNSVGTSYGDTITFTTSASAFTCGTSTVSYDGHNYTTVLIGTQCWFKENLRNDNYRDGTAILGNLDNATWSGNTSGAQAVYDQGGASEATNLATYGRLYNWYAVTNAAGLCPTGWHVPTDAEWTTLVTSLGSGAGDQLKTTSGWASGDAGTNTSGFSALPGGSRFNTTGAFANRTYVGNWWTSSPDGVLAWTRGLTFGDPNVARFAYYPNEGESVRCVQDPASAPTVDTDAATSVTSSAATLNATITATGGSAVTATGFKYGTDALLTSPVDVVGSGTTSSFTGVLPCLKYATQYWAVGYATNALGTSYGDTIAFTTSAFTCGTSTVSYDDYCYTTVLIGSQCWFKENLRNDNYNDGTPIPGGLDNSTWFTTTSGAHTVYGQGGANEAANLATYGRLYNWHAVTDAAGLCPMGWHVPTDSEWDTLVASFGGTSTAGNAMKSTTGWASGDGGTNTSGFSGLPGGFRYGNGNFSNEGSHGYWWTSSPDATFAWFRFLISGDPAVSRDSRSAQGGFSIRCLQD
ncbi:MAG: fibrobacter succinogenes major paralogous domain-containing protein, partial [Flavobacteriales bacterium]